MGATRAPVESPPPSQPQPGILRRESTEARPPGCIAGASSRPSQADVKRTRALRTPRPRARSTTARRRVPSCDRDPARAVSVSSNPERALESLGLWRTNVRSSAEGASQGGPPTGQPVIWREYLQREAEELFSPEQPAAPWPMASSVWTGVCSEGPRGQRTHQSVQLLPGAADGSRPPNRGTRSTRSPGPPQESTRKRTTGDVGEVIRRTFVVRGDSSTAPAIAPGPAVHTGFRRP
jgi:hypothetical protein